MSEYIYYRVNGGAVKAAHERWLAKRKLQIEARRAVHDEFDADGTYANDYGILGLVFKAPKTPPAGWVSVRDEVWKPNPRTKEGRKTRDRISKLPLCGAAEFQNEVLGQNDPFRFMRLPYIRHMVFEIIGGVLILCVPADGLGKQLAEWNPPDDQTVPLKNSEYWQLKEQAASVAKP